MNKSLQFLLMVFFASNAFSATFTVTSTTDVVDAVPGNGVCATAGGACTLRAAIQEANALAGADSIVVPSGIFPMVIAGVGEELAATGDYDISDELTITGAGAGLSIIDCRSIDRGFDVRTNVKTTFSKIWIKNCSVNGADGGAIRSVSTSNLTLSEAKLSNNRAENAGGLVHAGELVVTDSIIDRNYAANAIGGIYKHGNGNVAISSSDITSNTAKVLYGGLVVVSGNGSVSLSDSDILDNSAGTYGAGIVIAMGASGASVSSLNVKRNIGSAIGGLLLQTSAGPTTLTNSDVSDNVAFDSAGVGIGGLYVVSQGDLTASGLTISDNVSAGPLGGGQLSSTAGAININNSTFSSNSAWKDFGGVNLSAVTGLNITDTVVSDNIANNTASVDPSAGGMYVTIPATVALNLTRVTCSNNISLNSSGGCLRMATGGGALNITSSTFDGNYADSNGGAVIASLTSGTATSSITGSTFSNNSVSGGSLGGGLFLVSVHRVDVLNSTFSSNVAVSAAGVLFAGNPGIFFKNSTFFENKASGTGSSIGLLAGTANLENNILYDGNTEIAN
ncbi:MAG: CSLREA domain-containing protein, partial [SAR324 cluster bacterium]|nr:CSLREA domain-containing protein [SAR324 cluster bacterium]